MPFIRPSAWNRCSPKLDFRFTEFYEVHISPVRCRAAFLCTGREASRSGVHKRPIIPPGSIMVPAEAGRPDRGRADFRYNPPGRAALARARQRGSSCVAVPRDRSFLVLLLCVSQEVVRDPAYLTRGAPLTGCVVPPTVSVTPQRSRRGLPLRRVVPPPRRQPQSAKTASAS